MTRPAIRRVAVAAVVAAASAVSLVYGQARENLAGLAGVIGKLTPETRERAVECGRVGPDCAVAPYQLCPENRDYDVRLVTPFSRVALAAMDAKKDGRPLGRMGPASVNKWGVSLHIYPSGRPGAESLVGMELRRGARAVPPVSVAVGPLTVTASDGARVVSTRGAFSFSAEVFEPSTDVELVFFGSSTVSSCTVTRAHLGQLR